MKPLAPAVLLALWLALPIRPVRAQDAAPSPADAAIAQLDTDLLAIPAGSTVTDAQHQTLVADLSALAVGIVPAPDAANVDGLATILGHAAVAGNVMSDALAELNSDLAADATDSDDWLDDLTDDADDLLAPADTDPNPFIVDSNLLIETAASLHPRRTHQYHSFVLDVQNGQSPANQFYDGSVGLDTKQVAGSEPVSTISVRAVGLPRSNLYTVTITRKSDDAVVTLGLLNIHQVSSQEFNKYLTADIPDDYHQYLENLTVGQTVFGGDSRKTLLAGFDARDVANITLTDALGVARLSGHPGLGVNNYRTQEVVLHLYGSPAAPTATAVAKGSEIQSYASTFFFSARHLPAQTLVTLAADGVVVGQFITGANGQLLVTKGNVRARYNRAGLRLYPQTLPQNLKLSQVQSLALTDNQGNVLLSSPMP